MYNPLLDTFIAVVECGSFTKASEKLFMSPTAVMKQINGLENHLGFSLTERAYSGVKLTSAGEIIYREAKAIIAFSEKAVSSAMAVSEKYEKTFCVGTSALNPARPFMDLWYKVNGRFPDYKLHLVAFEDDYRGILSVIRGLGEKFDFLIGVCDSKAWLSLCNFLPLGRYRKMIAVSREHRLASKKSIEVTDLYGETLMMVKKGDSGVNDFIRHEIETFHPQIKIEDTARFYDTSVFNRCAETNNVLLTIECWQDVHPGLVTIPVKWDYSIPYGLLYSLNPENDVQKFVDTVRNLLSTNTDLTQSYNNYRFNHRFNGSNITN